MKNLLIPHITEKSYRTISEGNEQPNTYTFKVKGSAGKHDIKRIIERDHKVTVLNVRIAKIPGRNRRFKGIKGRTSAVTKAIVQLKKGDRIADFDNIQKEADKE